MIPSTHLQLNSFAIEFICNWPAHSLPHSPRALTFMAAHSPKRCDPGETKHSHGKPTQTRFWVYPWDARPLVKTDTNS